MSSETRRSQMYSSMIRLIETLTRHPSDSALIRWAAPVPFFGEITTAKVATVGINPSNLEFVGNDGLELGSDLRRLPTLRSLGLTNWSEVNGTQVRTLLRECEEYFARNPYRRWFDVLERILETSGHSYYPNERSRACHLDLVPFATSSKWGSLPTNYRRFLVNDGRIAMAEFIRDSPIEYLILNGRSVVQEFQSFAQVELRATTRVEWSLPRNGGSPVEGLVFEGKVARLGPVELERPILVVGYNHNLQSSFGVTAKAMNAIGQYIGDQIVAPATRATN